MGHKNLYDLEKELNNNTYQLIKYKGYEYYNIACNFDLLYSSYEIKREKIGIMYLMTLTINDKVYFIHSYDELKTMFVLLKEYLGLNRKRKLIIYVHNLQKVFQFIKKRVKWDNTFCMDTNEVLYATTKGVEFRDSEKLSGLSIKKIAELMGEKYADIDESNKAPGVILSIFEMESIVNNNIILHNYIKKCIKETEHNKITELPYTLTGYARQYVKKHVLGYGKNKYKTLVRGLQLNNEKEYNMLKNAFSGGYLYSNNNYEDKLIKNVHSYDFDSAYIYNLCTQKFPMSKGQQVEIKSKEDFLYYMKRYCCLFNVKFEEIEKKYNRPEYIQVNKCISINDYTENNGRVISADNLTTTITDIDFRIIKNNYNFEKMYISKMYIYKKDYLPKELIECIINLYQNKIMLKGTSHNTEYINAKRILNSIYGMIVTDINKDLVKYTNNGYKKENSEDFITKYNKDPNRFIFYPWGVWCTAYNRMNLFTAINEIGNDLLYSDTDSVKFINFNKHIDYFNKYNNYVKKQLNNITNHYNLDINKMGYKEYMLGIWEYEGQYDEFKTLGQKKYAYSKGGEYNITVSGLPKEKAKDYLYNEYKNNFVAEFSNSLVIPEEYSEKVISTNYENEINGYIKLENGRIYQYNELSYCFTKSVSYCFGTENIYINKILDLGGY